MEMKKISFLLCWIPFYAFAQKQDQLIGIGMKDSIRSSILQETRSYWVHLPLQYNSEMFGQDARYPVLYLLDGEAHFNSVSGLVEILGGGINGTHVIPDMIVIGIPNRDRTRDLTPTHRETDNSGKPQAFLKTSGGNDRFLNFLKQELIPHIDSVYRTMAYRVFVGHSFGGITVINALFTMPELFNGYIAIDPSLWWDNKVLMQKSRTYFQHTDLQKKSLFLAQANTLSREDTAVNEHFESIKEFATLLDTRNQSGIHWKYAYYADDDHGSVPMIAEYEGLRFLFRDYHIRFGEIAGHPELLKTQFQHLSLQTGVAFSPPEDLINGLGYNLMNSDKVDLAIQYFQMNIDNHPRSANAYDSMGEAWMKKGDTKKSIEYYQQSLQLNPQNDNAKKMIEKMKGKKS
jgi:predicted alpha/beta superfamily hydrolase